jgi:hypothetical protein
MVDDGNEGDSAPQPCRAVPAASRRGFREDQLCASTANTRVRFHGREVPVCRIHEKAYQRWADRAESNAALIWGWPVDGSLDQTGPPPGDVRHAQVQGLVDS